MCLYKRNCSSKNEFFIPNTFYQDGQCFVETARKYRTHFGRSLVPTYLPSVNCFDNGIKKFEQTGSVEATGIDA